MNELLQKLSARVDELEMRTAFQEDLLAELNALLTRQDAEILRLQKRLQSLGDQHQDLQYRVEQGPAQERPPHY